MTADGDASAGRALPQDEYDLFAQLSAMLADGIEANLARWTIGNIDRIATAAGIVDDPVLGAAARDAGERCRAEIGPRVRHLLEADIDEQRTTPLVILRDAVSYATAVLDDRGIPPVRRDEFERRSFPDDIYGLSPATMADVHESLGELAMMWGAAKAHVYKHRHM